MRQLSAWRCPHFLLSAVLQACGAAIDRHLSGGRSAANPQQRREAG